MSKQCCKKFIDKSKEFFFEKSSVFPPKMCKLSLTRQAASTKTQTKRKMENIMKTGKITANLRDEVPVFLMVEGQKVKRYKNIDLPDMLKEVEMLDFHFNVPENGKVTFEINYAQGVLPEILKN